MKRIELNLILLLFLSACFKEEEPRFGKTNYETVVLGDDYNNQIFYSLSNDTIISINSYKDWNLAFYTGSETSFIRLNSAANSWAVKTNSTNFNDNFSDLYNPTAKRYDGSHGYTNNLAIDIIGPGITTDTVRCDSTVYLLHPGIDANGDDIGEHIKFIFKGIFYDSYLIQYANLDGSNMHEAIIPKNNSINYLAYNWNTHSIVTIEPDKTTWDLLFTRFTDTVYTNDGTVFLAGYAVTGAYLNETGVSAYLEEDMAYEEINASNINLNRLSTRWNAIGHNWKQFSGQYAIFNNKSYIIQDADNRIFKLRFLGFYDAQTGQKGYPSFEFELLR